jgi:rSAM/selenodomain-associated transferase 1
MRRGVLLVFVKAPRPGQVKTRLAAAIGDEPAAAAYRALAEGVLERTAPREGEYERIVLFAPPDAREEVARWLPAEPLAAQEGPDLGARMDAAFAAAFAGGAPAAVLVGSDVPRLDRGHVLRAFAALEEHPVVLGPAADGGYYLVGLRERRPELFAGVEWGTAGVLAATLERCAALGLRPRLLETLADVDTEADL